MTDKTRGDGEITWAGRRYVLIAEEKWDKTQDMSCGRSVYDNLCHQIRAHSKRIEELEQERDEALRGCNQTVYDNLHKEIDMRDARIKELEKEITRVGKVCEQWRDERDDLGEKLDASLQDNGPALNEALTSAAAWEIKAKAFQKERDVALDDLHAEFKKRNPQISELVRERNDAEEQVTRLLASNARLTSDCDAARSNEATWRQNYELAMKSVSYWKQQVETGAAVDERVPSQKAHVDALLNDLSKANDKAEAWRKARDAERNTVQRLQTELAAWDIWTEGQRKYVRKLTAKLRRARKQVKRLRKGADRCSNS